MSVYSTMDITRADAIAVILEKLATASDDTIASMLFDLVGDERLPDSWLNNFRIVNDYRQSDNWRLTYRPPENNPEIICEPT